MQTWESLNPATGEVLGSFEAEDADGVRAHVGRARQALADWRKRPIGERVRLVKRLRDELAASGNDLARVVSSEIGKPWVESLSAEIVLTLDGLDYLVANAAKVLAPVHVRGGFNAKAMGFRRAVIHREPVGVVGILGTWNYPVLLNCIQAATALVAGNTVVLKPSERATVVAERMTGVFRAAGFGEGLFEVALGGPETGQALAEADCDKYVLTGGLDAGRAVLETLVERIKPAVLELSGQDAAVVCADADVAAAARTLTWGAFTNCGQTCVAVRRIYYDKAIEESFVPAMLDAVRGIRLGNPLDAETDVGPLCMPELVERAERLIRQAQSEGAKVLVGGERVELGSGNYFAPTVLTGIDERSDYFKEELFGPLTVLCPVESAAEGIARANRSRYGLGASVWTRDVRAGERLGRELEAGMVSINSVITPVGDCRLPFGGFKESGYGRTHGASGLLEMTAERVVARYQTPAAGRGNSYPYSKAMEGVLQAVLGLRTAPGVTGKVKAFGRLLGAVGSLVFGGKD